MTVSQTYVFGYVPAVPVYVPGTFCFLIVVDYVPAVVFKSSGSPPAPPPDLFRDFQIFAF